MANTVTVRTRSAGRVVEVTGYEHMRRTDDPRVRSVKQKQTNEVMQKYNDRSSIEKFALMLAANYDKGDIVGTLTYDDKHLPSSRKEANTRFRCFRDRIKKAWRERGLDPDQPVFFWSTENKHGDGRWHHHFILTATGEDFKMIRKAWIYGPVDEFDSLQVNETKNYDTLATYYAKEPREKLGLRSWSCSRNAKKPEETTEYVDSEMDISAPAGVRVIENHIVETPFGRFFYLKYISPMQKPSRSERIVRRRRSA